MRISATVITLNEEHNLAEALESLWWADEIIIVDSESDDRTLEIARQFTDRVFVRPWPGYSAQKNFAAEQAASEWVFNLDADERVSDELAQEIVALKRGTAPAASGFEMPRLTFYLGRWVKHSGWYPDYKLRLYRRAAGSFLGDYIHESVSVNGSIERLKGNLLHYTLRNSSEHHLRLDRYTTIAAREQVEKGKKATLAALLLSPAVAFIRSYIFRLGFLDGVPGLAIAYFAAHYVFLKKLKVWEAGRAVQVSNETENDNHRGHRGAERKY
jgi:glycosyltransferase involved in cell wall biosynthesis